MHIQLHSQLTTMLTEIALLFIPFQLMLILWQLMGIITDGAYWKF